MNKVEFNYKDIILEFEVPMNMIDFSINTNIEVNIFNHGSSLKEYE